MHELNLHSFNSNSAILGFATRFHKEFIRFQTKQVSKRLFLPTDFCLADTHDRGENLKANIDGRSELFLPENSVLTEFALRYMK